MFSQILHSEEIMFVPLSPNKDVDHFIGSPSVCNYVIIVPYPKLPNLS